MSATRRGAAEVGFVGWVCDICGTADALGLGSCATCAASESDTLLFIRPAERRAERRVIEAWLVGALDGIVSREEARDAAVGQRPIVRLSSGAAGRATGVLSLRGVHAVAVADRKAWRRVPWPLLALAGASAGAGLHVGLTSAPFMLVLGPVFAGLLVAAAVRRVGLPVWRPASAPVLGLPAPIEDEVRAALARLRPGRARRYLKDLTALVATLVGDEQGSAGEELEAASQELLALACRAASDLEHLDDSLDILERQPSAGAPDTVLEGAARSATDARDALIGRFEEAIASLARARASTARSPQELLRLADRLSEEAQRRAEAWQEVQRLAG